MIKEEKDWSKFSKGYYKGIKIGYKERYDLLLNAIYQRIDTNTNIAKKYNVSISRISQLKKELNQLKYKPEIINGKIKCQICDNQKGLNIHHNYDTGETIAILCHKCNIKVENNELEYVDKYRKSVELKNKIYDLIKLEEHLTINQISKKLTEKENYTKIYHYIQELIKENKVKINKNRNLVYFIRNKYSKKHLFYWFKPLIQTTFQKI